MTSKSIRDFTCRFIFHDDLDFFLSPDVNPSDCIYQFNGKPSVKDAIESQGIPHTEAGQITANGMTVDFGYHCMNGDSIDVYSANSENVIKNGSNLRKEIIGLPRFILDVHLGKLSRHLRLLGFDCIYRNDFDDPDIVRLSAELDRVVLTRDRRLLCIRTVTH